MADQEEQLRIASKNGDADKITSLLEAGTKQTSNEEGQTPIFLASSSYCTEPKFVDALHVLLDADASTINVKTKDGDAPIHSAASNGHLEIMELLLEYGADLDLEGQSGTVPLGLAAMKKHYALVNMILKHLMEDKKFSEKQVKWIFSAKDENQRLNIFRAVAVILKVKGVLPLLLQYNLLDAITKGICQQKKSLQTHALQLLKEIVQSKEGLELAQKNNIAKVVQEITQTNNGDAVLQHLGNEILGTLK